MEKKLRDVQVGDQDEKDKGDTKGQRGKASCAKVQQLPGVCWLRLDPIHTWPQMISLTGSTAAPGYMGYTFPPSEVRLWAHLSQPTGPETPRAPP